MTVQVNGGNLAVTHKETFSGYKKYVLFSKDAITNVISVKNLIEQYRVTYDRIDQILLAHKGKKKPSIKSRIYKTVLYFYNPNDKVVVLRNTISGNKQGFTKRQINGSG